MTIELEAKSDAFAQALASLRIANHRPELAIEQIPAPNKLASEAVAFAASVETLNDNEALDLGTGRFVLLHDEKPQEPWGGHFRIVAFAKSPLETFIGAESMITEVAWSWLLDSLEQKQAHFSHEAGTATRVISQGFGSLAGQSEHAELELRVSWTPSGNIGAHLEAWQDLICMMAGLPNLPASVAKFPV